MQQPRGYFADVRQRLDAASAPLKMPPPRIGARRLWPEARRPPERMRRATRFPEPARPGNYMSQQAAARNGANPLATKCNRDPVFKFQRRHRSPRSPGLLTLVPFLAGGRKNRPDTFRRRGCAGTHRARLSMHRPDDRGVVIARRVHARRYGRTARNSGGCAVAAGGRIPSKNQKATYVARTGGTSRSRRRLSVPRQTKVILSHPATASFTPTSSGRKVALVAQIVA